MGIALRADVPTGPSIYEIAARQVQARRKDALERARSMRDYAELIPVPGVGRLRVSGDWGFQAEPFYSDEVANAREAVYCKSTQVGASEGQLRWAIREADQLERHVIYTFPTKSDVTEFTDTRLEPMIEGSEFLSGQIPPEYIRTKTLKQIGAGFITFRGSRARTGAQSTAAQSLVFDEYDDLDQRNLAQMERRLSGAKQAGKPPRIRRFGIPTVPDFGIDAQYKQSDRREYHVTCPACGLEQELIWEKNVRWAVPGYDDKVFRAGKDAPGLKDKKAVESAWRCCRACEESLEAPGPGLPGPLWTAEDGGSGRWVAKNPGATTIGYRVHRLIVPGADLEEVVRNSRLTKPHEIEAFNQNDLGRAYIDAESALSEEAINRAAGLGYEPVDHYGGTLPILAALDVASARSMHMVISELQPSGERKHLWVGEIHDFAEAARKMNAYRILCLVIDYEPERREATELVAMYPGRVFLVRYDWNLKASAIAFDPSKSPIAAVNRTGAIDAMMDGIRGLRTIPTRILPSGYVEHLTALKRRIEYTPKGEPYPAYMSTGPDDYGHAETYLIVAQEIAAMMRGAQIQAAQRRRPVPDRALGLRRLGLDRASDEYRAGFGWDE